MKKAKIINLFFAFITIISTLFLFNQPVAAADKKVASDSVMKKIKQSKELVVGTSADYPPLEFTTSVNGNTKYVGVDIELAKDIAKDLHAMILKGLKNGNILKTTLIATLFMKRLKHEKKVNIIMKMVRLLLTSITIRKWNK